MLRAAASDQIQRRFRFAGEVGGLPVTVDVHLEHARAFKEEVIVKRCDLQPFRQQRGHDRITSSSSRSSLRGMLIFKTLTL